jgi:type IV pilus assembly protein PilQ
VAVLDNQEAKIQQGTSVPFLSQTDSQVTTIFVEATLVLEVTPHVTPDGSILMKLRVANDEPDFATPSDAGPPIKRKEAKTNIMVKDGETAVLGGIFVSNKAESQAGLPWLMKIPFLGWLFKQESKSETTSELLVFLTPKIIR